MATKETALDTVQEGTYAVVKTVDLAVTPEIIAETTRSIALLQDMVKNTLVRGIDYGRIPGTPQDSLWDPGSSRIISSFNCYCGQRRILKLEDTNDRIVACVEVPIVSRITQQEVASGIGAASTLEVKYKYRWVANPKEWGYDEEATKSFKTKKGKEDGRDVILYRIPNPEHSELLNTIVKMASKRAEVDAAESLPGVASVLRQIFSGKPPKNEYAGPRWQRYWGEATRLGYTEDEAHAKLGVASMYDWLKQGRSLDEAITVLRGHSKKKQPAEVVSEGEGPVSTEEDELFGGEEQTGEEPPTEPPPAEPPPPQPKRDPESIKTINELNRACWEDYGLQPPEVLKELGYSSASQISETPSDCYRKIAAVRA